MVFGKKKSNSKEEMTNWYQDRYSSVAIQRNFLLLFSVFTCGALLVCLMILKSLQEQKGAEPYLVEYDKNSGYMTIVEAQSKKEYTAQQAVKESMVLQYLYHREAPKLTTIEEDMNYVRVSTASLIYDNYTSSVSKLVRELRSAGQIAKYDIKIKSLSYLASNRIQLTITRKLIGDNKEISSTDYKIVITFAFVDLEVPIDDLRINPLGFQVQYYNVVPMKTFKSAINIDGEESEKKND